MRQILDLHIHSKYSRACSQALTLPNIAAACKVKGIDIIATGDFTHPAWFSDIQKFLEPCVGGSETDGFLYQLKNNNNQGAKFILSTEVALIYKDVPRARRIHLVVQAPSIAAVAELNNYLATNGFNIKSDGRPILGMSAPEFVKICLTIHPKFLIYPAHIWTPWFAVFGSKSGFDSMAECFYEQTKDIFAFETGLSSDPEMNWRVSALDQLTLLSNSDAHSLQNLGREANIFDLPQISYAAIYQAIKYNQQDGKATIEFYPEEGMYHFDGHSACKVSMAPLETAQVYGLCPVCKKPLTIGVMNRVEELADRPLDYVPKLKPVYYKLVELDKIIAQSLGIKSRNSKAVQKIYNQLINFGGNELNILLDLSIDKIQSEFGAYLAEGIRRMRAGEVQVTPGFDGQYGVVTIFKPEEIQRQKSLF